MTGQPNPSRKTKLSGANGVRETLIFPVQLTTSRIGNLIRLIYTLLFVMTIHTTVEILLPFRRGRCVLRVRLCLIVCSVA